MKEIINSQIDAAISEFVNNTTLDSDSAERNLLIVLRFICVFACDNDIAPDDLKDMIYNNKDIDITSKFDIINRIFLS